MSVRRTSHAVYDTKYHLVWAPKYRKWILRGDIRKTVLRVFRQIATDFDFWIEELAVAPDHVHIFLSFPPRYSIAKVVGIFKSICASRVFDQHPEVKRQLWGGHFWAEGYFVRTVGDQVTADVVRRYIQYQKQQDEPPSQLDMFEGSHE